MTPQSEARQGEGRGVSEELPHTFRFIPCSESGCTNDAEMMCNRCDEIVCGSCFNGQHEWKERCAMSINHWTADGDLVVEEKTLFRPVGWRGQSGRFYPQSQPPMKADEPGSFSPVYEQIATWVEGEGWHD